METKLFSIILCLLVLEATGSSLKNLTSIQHGTENASARSMLTGTVTFDFFDHCKKLYARIYNYIPPDEKKNHFAFLMIVPSYHFRWFIPDGMRTSMLNTGLPSLQTAEVYPPNAVSNLVIAGVTHPKPRTGDLPAHAEQKLINVMITMDRFYDATFGYICPWFIVLGSAFDTCCGKDFEGKQHDKTLEIVYRRATGKLTTEIRH